MFNYSTSFGQVQVEYDQNHYDQTVAVGYWLNGRELDLDDDVELIMNIERELHRQAMAEWNQSFG